MKLTWCHKIWCVFFDSFPKWLSMYMRTSKPYQKGSFKAPSPLRMKMAISEPFCDPIEPKIFDFSFCFSSLDLGVPWKGVSFQNISVSFTKIKLQDPCQDLTYLSLGLLNVGWVQGGTICLPTPSRSPQNTVKNLKLCPPHK